MEPIAGDQPIRLGVVGLGHTGLFHLERLSLHPDFQPAAVFDPLPGRAALAESFGCRVCRSWRELLDLSDVPLLLIAAPASAHAALVCDALETGKHVVVDHPVCLSTDETRLLQKALGGTAGSLSVMRLRSRDDDFWLALEAVQSGTLGRLRAVKSVWWCYASEPAQEPASSTTSGDRPTQLSARLTRIVAHQLDQLLRLVDATPRSVYARTAPPIESITTPATSGQPRRRPSDAMHLLIEFDDGLQADIDVNLSSFVVVDGGWLVLGTRGAYEKLRCYQMAEDGEIFSESVPMVEREWEWFYGRLSAYLRGAGPPVGPLEHAARVVELLQAACQSAATHCPVSLPLS